MAESKFLKYQDKNGNGLNDVCPDDEIIRVNNCPDCKRNPSAVVPKWKKRDVHEPWFNDKYCTFQITIHTLATKLMPSSSSTEEEAAAFIEELFKSYAGDAVQGLLDGFNKKEGADITRDLLDVIEYTKYDLDTRPASRVKLLYTVKYQDFAALEERPPPDDDDEDEGSEVTFTYDASKINPKLLKLRKAMYLYARYYRVYQALENGSFIFIDSGKVFTKTQFDRYGDLGFFLGTSRMKDILSDLDNWLNDRGMNIFGVGGGWGWFRDRVTKIEFTLTPEKKLKKLKVWTATCREKPRVYGSKRLKALVSKSSWKDPTAVNYFSKLNEIDNFLSARVERPWIEFVTTYTYPEVAPQFNYPQEEPPRPQTAGSCLADALENEAKQLGQDILDDVFSIGDAIAYAFHKNVCQETEQDLDDERNQIGLVYKPESEGTNIFGGQKVDFGKVIDKSDGRSKNIFGMATEQAFQQLYTDDNMFVAMCARVLAASMPFPGGGERMIHDMWKFGFGRMKECGFLDLMINAIECLFKGLTLEEALASVIKSALKAMSIENFGDLFMGLPPDKQAELEKMVKQRLESGDIFPDGASQPYEAVDEQGRKTKDFDRPFYGKTEWNFSRPWEDQALIDAERESAKEGNYGTFPRPKNPMGDGHQRNERTLAQQYDIAGSAKAQLPPDTIMQAYIGALIEVYGDDLLGLTDLLNKYPGAQIIANIIASVDCPTPPIFDPNFFDFLKSLELPFCRNVNEINMFRLENPFEWLPYLYDIPRLLFEALLEAIQTVVMSIIMKILVKLCQIIGDAICKAIEIAGQLAVAVPRALATGNVGVFSDVIRDAICGPNADQGTIDATIAEMFEKLGVGGAALADTQAVKSFTNDMSAATTRAEMMEAFLGTPSNDFIDITYTILENQYPQFLDGLPTRSHLSDFFVDVGNLFPAEVKATMSEMLNVLPPGDMLPANPSLCATPQDIDNFKERRCLLLEGRATPAQCRQMFQDLQDETLEDLDELTNIMQGGIPQAIADAMPPVVSQPGCDDGLIPFESEENQKLVGFALGGGLKQIEMEFIQDMISEGTVWSGDSGWGMLNMILSDTNGNPLTTHQEKVANRTNQVDFVIDTDNILETEPFASMDAWIRMFYMPTNGSQNGQYPSYVAEWLWEEMLWLDMDFQSSNTAKKAKSRYKTFDSLGWSGWFWTDINLLSLPEFGWSVKLETQMGADRLKITKSARKNSPDLTLSYTDNAGGYAENNGAPWNWGYNVKLFISELHKVDASSATVAAQMQQARESIGFSEMEQNPIYQESSSSNNVAAEAFKAVEAALKNLEAVLSEYDGQVFANRPGDNARVLLEGKYRKATALPAGFNTMSESQKNAILAAVKDDENKAITYERHEVYTVDNTLDYIDTREYTNFNACFSSRSKYMPQLVLLAEILSKNGDKIYPSALKSTYDSTNTAIFKQIRDDITGPNSSGVPEKASWMYGAAYDDLTLDDLEYVVDKGQTLSSGGTSYGDAEMAEYDENGDRDGQRSITNDDMVLGMSKMQYDEQYNNSGRKNRIFYLDPGTYGGSYMSPKIYIKPAQNLGWRGFIDVVYPELSPCKPSKQNLVGFRDIEEDMSSTYNFIPEDQRLKSSEDCVVEKPYNRILERSSKVGIQGAIRAACRIFAGTHLIKSMATFSTFAPRFSETCSSLYAAYIVNIMEESLKDSQGGFWELFNTFKDEEFWYAFLEQSVQTYGRLVDDETIQDPPSEVLEALFRINDMQEKYRYPYGDDLDRARAVGRAEPWPFDTLDSFRYEENLNAVKATEDDAKLVLKELVMRELNIIGERFIENMRAIDLEPEYTDMDYYVMSKLSRGAIDLDLDKEIIETVSADIPLEGSGWYTLGDQFSKQDGTPYMGYYHVHTDEDGNTIYMEGEYHTSEAHEELNLFADKKIVPIGDIAGLHSATGDGPFVLEKYISVDGVKYSPSRAISLIKENDPQLNLSEVYPGTLEHVHFQPRGSESEVTNTRVVGLKGELGVRYGLQFSIMVGGTKRPITSVEIDSLDVKVGQFPIVWEGNSHLLLCLIKKLKEDNDFRLVARYVFPLTKAVATMAIYNDYGFMAAIGEKAVDVGDAMSGDLDKKPGTKVILDSDGVFQGYQYGAGWAAKPDRATSPSWPWSWFVARMPWDEWDKVLLRNSKSRIKSIFKGHYHQRDFAPWDDDGFNPGAILLKNLKSAFAIPPLAGQMPWWSKRRLVTNPFDAHGNMCKKR